MVPAKSPPSACSMSDFLRPESNMRCSKRLTMTRGFGPSPSRSRIAATSALAWRMLGTVISLAIESFWARFYFLEVQPRLDIEIVGTGAMLEIEVDEADGGPGALAAMQQEQCGLDRQSGDAGAADRGNERIDLRLGGLGASRTGDACAGADQLQRRHRLDQEI